MQFFKFTRVGRMIPVTVLKRAGGRWKVVEAGMSSAGIVIRRARVLGNSGAPLSPSDRGPLDRAIRASEAAPADAIPSLNNHGQVILLAGSDRSICRLMQLPQASEEDTRRMVALRLETELPYPVAESLWACERAAAPEAEGASPARNGATSVILLATPMAEIAESEKSLGLTGRSPCAVQLEAGALAELGQAAARPAETVALCRVEDRASDVVILHHGRLRYARRLFSGGPQCGEPDAEERRKLCDELDQCLHHYALAPDAAAPTRLILTGEGARVPGLAFELGRRVGLPAEVMALPAAVRVEGKEGGAEDLLAEFPACVGALLAALRTLRGERPAAPPLRRSREPLLRRLGWQASLSRRRGALAGMSFVMVVALVAISFAVRKARSEEATRAFRQGQPFLRDMGKLQNEVDALEYEEPLQRSALDVLLEFSKVLPKSAKLLTFDLGPRGKISFTAAFPMVEDASDKTVRALQESTMFANPKFMGATQQEGQFKCTLTCELKQRAGRGNNAGGETP